MPGSFNKNLADYKFKTLPGILGAPPGTDKFSLVSGTYLTDGPQVFLYSDPTAPLYLVGFEIKVTPSSMYLSNIAYLRIYNGTNVYLKYDFTAQASVEYWKTFMVDPILVPIGSGALYGRFNCYSASAQTAYLRLFIKE